MKCPFARRSKSKTRKKLFNWSTVKFLLFSIIFVMAFTSFSPSHAYDTAHKICIHSNHPRQGFLPLSAGFPIKIFIFVRANTSERQIIKFTDMKNTGVSSTTYLPAKLPFRTISNSLRLMRITIWLVQTKTIKFSPIYRKIAASPFNFLQMNKAMQKQQTNYRL